MTDEYENAAHVKRLVDGWPPLSDRQRDQLTLLLHPGAGPRPEPVTPPRAEDAPGFRLTEGGKQIVRFGRYSYLWAGDEPLALGDLCLLPASWVPGSEPHAERVTGFGTDYDGELVYVVKVILRAPRQEAGDE
jgi:hypothetical protein